MIAAESRFNLAYDASHALALAALRIHGFRADKRYVVFQALQHALGVDIPTWRLLDRCHRERNATEYGGRVSVDQKLLVAMRSVESNHENEPPGREEIVGLLYTAAVRGVLCSRAFRADRSAPSSLPITKSRGCA